ncbi:integrase [Pseudomonas syringae]|nr:integrase [Pseudomonas syringae]RXT87524.1 integrase [Pseudomonas syringae]RXU00939.1 integrase [Pseudomonas syringae]RXU09181.1 integrase [Pseudomonas syringae]RXU22683.1 integrase [Pseudomonas syringae]
MSDLKQNHPQQSTGSRGMQQGAFQPLQQDAFTGLQHAPFLKGLLKPFKGKGGMLQLTELCRSLEGDLNALAEDQVLAQANRHPYTLLPVRMVRQRTSAGTVFLRWQEMGTRQMGVNVWSNLLADPRTPESLLQDLHSMEQQRVALNMQISLVHTIGRQAAECAEKMAQADAVYSGRLQQISQSSGITPHTQKES